MTDWMAMIKEAPRDHKEAKKQVSAMVDFVVPWPVDSRVPREALIRDGFRCVVSGRFDVQAAKIPSTDKEEIRRPGVGVLSLFIPLYCCRRAQA